MKRGRKPIPRQLDLVEIKASAWPKRLENEFCDLIADGVGVMEAGRLVGVAEESTKSKWRAICGRYGEQAK